MMLALNWKLLANSLFVAAASTFLASCFAFAYALLASAVSRTLRRVLLACAIAVLALPSFLVTNSWIDLLGTTGWLRSVLPFNLFSLPGTIWILSLMLWPIPAIAIWSAWRKLEPVHFEIDSALRGFKLIRLLLWPTAKSLAWISAAVIFALALSNFAVPAILQVKVYPAEAWLQFNTNLDAAAARKLSWPLFVAPLLLFAFARLPELPWPREAAADFSRTLRRQLGWPLLAGVIALSTAILLLALFLPLAQLFVSPRTWSEFLPALHAGIPALSNSVVYAVAAASITLALGLLLARMRWFGWLWLLFFFPGILLGISAVVAFNRPGLEWFSRTSLIVISLLIVHYLAITRSICRRAFRAVDTTILDAGRLDGATGLTLFRHIVLPQIAPQVAAAAYLVYVLSLWDVETILMVIPPGGETLALRIFNLLHYGHNSHVNALCMLLLLVALAPLALFALWRSAAALRRRSHAESIA